jgi:hypothetical protein
MYHQTKVPRILSSLFKLPLSVIISSILRALMFFVSITCLNDDNGPQNLNFLFLNLKLFTCNFQPQLLYGVSHKYLNLNSDELLLIEPLRRLIEQ